MKFSLPSNWSGNFENDGILYFAQRLEEMLFDYSIDLYRMPLLNTHGLICEYCNVANKVNSGEVKEYQRDIVYDELLKSLKNDIVLKECWGDGNVEKIFKSFGSSSQQEKYNIIAYLGATLENGRYYDWCVKTIIKYTSEPKQKRKLEATIRCFLPEILSMGYNADFVYIELKKHFFKNKTIDENSVKNFLEIFNFRIFNYLVYFSVSATVVNFKDILEKRLNLNFKDDGNFKFFKKDRNKRIVYFKDIKATCPNTAAQIAYKRLDLFFSFYKFVGNKKSFAVQRKAMVIEKDKLDPVFVDAKKIAYNIIDDIDFKKIGNTSDRLLTGLLINAQSEYSLLSKAIELHNTALSVSDLKSGFLNLWASIEVLCQNENAESKLESVLKNVIPILKKDYLVSIIVNINECLKDNLSKQSYNNIIDQIKEVGCQKKKIFYLLLLPKYKDLKKNVIDELKNYPVLRSRILEFENMKSTKELREFIDSYVQRVTWHLYRMYRTRNAIIHSGEVPHNLKYLGEHLHSYVDAILTDFIVKLSGEIPFESVENVKVDIKFAVNNLDKTIEKDVDITEEVINILIHPEIGKVLNCERHIKEISTTK